MSHVSGQSSVKPLDFGMDMTSPEDAAAFLAAPFLSEDASDRVVIAGNVDETMLDVSVVLLDVSVTFLTNF